MRLTYYLATLVSAAAIASMPTLRAIAAQDPPRPQTTLIKEICLPETALEKVCKDKVCSPQPRCKPVKPRIPRDRCTEHYQDVPDVVGLCLHSDDAQRLQTLDGLIVEEGPADLCPWGGSYRCHALSVEKVTRYVDRPIVIPFPEEDSILRKSLQDTLQRVWQLEQENRELRGHCRRPLENLPSSSHEDQFSLYFGGLARFTAQKTYPAFFLHGGFYQRLGKHFSLGAEALLLAEPERSWKSFSSGEELLPDLSTKYWTDSVTSTGSSISWGIGGTVSGSLPFLLLENGLQVSSELTGGLYAILSRRGELRERTSFVALTDGSALGPKTISEPGGAPVINTSFGTTLSARLMMSYPLSQSSAGLRLIGSLGVIYLYVPQSTTVHSLGGDLGIGVEF